MPAPPQVVTLIEKIYEDITSGKSISGYFDPAAVVSFRDNSRDPEELRLGELDERFKQRVQGNTKTQIGVLCCTAIPQGYLVSVLGQYEGSDLGFEDSYAIHMEEKFIYVMSAHFLVFPTK